MKFKILLITALLFTISISLFAKPVVDSIGVKNVDGKKVVLFKVKPKDTYYSIGRRYGVKPAAIMKYNDTKKETLTIGAIVKVPTDIPYKKSGKGKAASESVVKETKKEKKARLAREAKQAKKHRREEQAPEEEAPVTAQRPVPQQVIQTPAQVVQQPRDTTPPTQYKVSAGETLYAISKRFNTTVDQITKLNNLTSTTLVPGQVLLVKSGAAAPPLQPVAVHHDTVVAKRDSTYVSTPLKDTSSNERHLNANRYGLYEKNEKGAATWIDEPGLDPKKKLVLHRTAPVGTVIKITNPMTNRTTFAKVVGSFTDSESTKDVIIVMTKNVAESLGAIDKRFYVNISYGSPNE